MNIREAAAFGWTRMILECLTWNFAGSADQQCNLGR